MEKKKSLLQSIFLRVHYKTSLGMIAVFLGLMAFSGYYLFGQNIIKDAERSQSISQFEIDNSGVNSRSALPEGIVTPGESENRSDTSGEKIGGQSVDSEVTPTAVATPTVVPTQASPSATPVIIVSPEATQFIMGDPNAEISMLIYYDLAYQPYGEYITNILPTLKEEYIDTNEVKVIFKNYPLNKYVSTSIAHNAAMCAADQGSFMTYKNMLITNHSEWRDKGAQEVVSLMVEYAGELDLNSDAFSACLNQSTFANYIAKDKQEAKSRGVSEAPTFIVGDTILKGLYEIDIYRSVLDDEINK